MDRGEVAQGVLLHVAIQPSRDSDRQSNGSLTGRLSPLKCFQLARCLGGWAILFSGWLLREGRHPRCLIAEEEAYGRTGVMTSVR